VSSVIRAPLSINGLHQIADLALAIAEYDML
jgi:hypothetical protein